jgi:radical SAM protein with 4Fe4S-binding SPASM domain
METELFLEIAHQASREPLLRELILMLQNEPLLDDRIFEFVGHFKSLNGRVRANIATNGELIDSFERRAIVQSNLDDLQISLNAHTEATFNKVNRGIDYKRVTANIHRLLASPGTRKKVAIGYVLTSQNREEVPQGAGYWSSRGARIRVWELSNRAGTLRSYGKAKPLHRRLPGLMGPKDFVSARVMGHLLGTCPFPFQYMCVLFNGDVLLCCNDWNRRVIVGNAKEEPLRQIWTSSRMNHIRQLLLEGRSEDIPSCRGCSTLAHFARPKSGRSTVRRASEGP